MPTIERWRMVENNLKTGTPATLKTELSAVRERIAAAKQRGRRDGFIGYYGCIHVTREFLEILDDAGKATERGEYTLAYSVAALILVNLAKLASSADDSAGGITDARYYVRDVLEKVCSGVEYGSKEAEYIFTQSIKDSRNKAFDGWREFPYDILLKTARLATKDNKNKMYEAVKDLHTEIRKESYSSWADEYDALAKLEIIKATGSSADTADFINANLKYNAVRRVAVNNAIASAHYDLAEKLCRDKLDAKENLYEHSRPSEWRYLLFEIYDKSGNTEKKIQMAEDLLFRVDMRYYGILKQLLIEKGVWSSSYPALLERLGKRLPYHIFMKLLSDEGETQRLLEKVREYPSEVFEYGKQLAGEWPAEIYEICLGEIRRQGEEANNLIKYKKVCGAIKKLSGFGGVSEAESIIAELKSKYQRRPTMQKELDALSAKLRKRE